MKPLTASQVGSALGRAGFQSQRGATWAHGFKASVLMPGTVAVSAQFSRTDQETEALISYAEALIAAGFQVENAGNLLFVTR